MKALHPGRARTGDAATQRDAGAGPDASRGTASQDAWLVGAVHTPTSGSAVKKRRASPPPSSVDACRELPRLQAKLAVGPAGGPLEQEADLVADQVIRMPDPASPIARVPLQVSCKCAECEEEDRHSKALQMKPAGPSPPESDEAPGIVHDALRSHGQPLDPATRAYFEPRFGHDFSDVRVHTDDRAAESAGSIGAVAYTAGSHIAFATGRYDPDTSSGRRLLAHELTHVVQQRTADSNTALSGSASIQRDAPVASGAVGEQNPAGEPFVVVPLSPAAAVQIPPDEDDCPPPPAAVASNVAAGDAGDAEGAPGATSGSAVAEGPSAQAAVVQMSPDEGTVAPTPAAVPSNVAGGSSGAAGGSAGPNDPCLLAPAPPGAISDFEAGLRNNPGRIMGVVIDPDNPGEIIGYRLRSDPTVLQIVDREGNFVAGNEKSLDKPMLDPIDFIPTPGAVVKGTVVVGKVGLKVLGKLVAKDVASESLWKISAAAIPKMRAVSAAMLGVAARAARKDLPDIALKVTEEGLNHSFDRHAGQWFGREVSRLTHFESWRQVIARASASSQIFPWSVGADKTIAKLATIEGKTIVVQFFQETGELATAFVPTQRQLKQMLAVLAKMK